MQQCMRMPGVAKQSLPRCRQQPQGLACCSSQPRRPQGTAHRWVVVAQGSEVTGEVDLEDQVEAFMKRQAEVESGAAFARTVDPAAVIGADVVDDETAKGYCRDVVDVLKTLKKTRDMSVSEAKLIVSIEDPRAKEERAVGIEDARGVSRDEMALALMDIAEGRVPLDRIALKCLRDEVVSWPFLAADEAGSVPAPSVPSTPAADYASLMDVGGIARPYVMGEAARQGDRPQDVADMMPSWVGYGTLYGVSAIPIMLGLSAVLILFYNSLR